MSPPHVTGHGPYGDHGPQFPDTESENKSINYITAQVYVRLRTCAYHALNRSNGFFWLFYRSTAIAIFIVLNVSGHLV